MEGGHAICWVAAIPYVIAAVSAAGSAAAVVQNNKSVQAQLTGAGNAQTADYNAISAQMAEVDDGASAAAREVQAEANRARATLRVAQGESGLVGPTQLRELAAQKEARDANLATIEANRTASNAQIARAKAGIDINAAGRMAEANAKVIGPMGAGLQIGGAAISGYFTGKTASQNIFPSGKLNNPPSSTSALASTYSDV